MTDKNGFVQSAPLPPLNAPTISAADRSRVYAVIGKQLNDILNGALSYDSDSVQKNSTALLSGLNDFVGAVERLKDAVNDPTNIMEDVVRDLKGFRDAFGSTTSNDAERMWDDPLDGRDKAIKLPDSLTPATRDNKVIYVDPDPGPYSSPNPVSPKQRPRDYRASFEVSDGPEKPPGRLTPDSHPRQVSRTVNSSLAGKDLPMQPMPALEAVNQRSFFNDKPIPPWGTPPIFGSPDPSAAAGKGSGLPSAGGVVSDGTQASAFDAAAAPAAFDYPRAAIGPRGLMAAIAAGGPQVQNPLPPTAPPNGGLPLFVNYDPAQSWFAQPRIQRLPLF
jgi:hypothetical protein